VLNGNKCVHDVTVLFYRVLLGDYVAPGVPAPESSLFIEDLRKFDELSGIGRNCGSRINLASTSSSFSSQNDLSREISR
jgi:hypothetical protein